MKFIVGIGNPERKYDGTRHNVGFDVVDFLAEEIGVSANWKEVRKLRAHAVAVGEAMLVKPQTFVNLSGDSVAGILREYHPRIEDILIVCDDVNLMFTKLRIRREGSAGGHHGLESIIAELGSEDFPRLRFGVKREGMPQDLNGFVLEKFYHDEIGKVPELKDRAASICKSWIQEGFDAAQKMLSQLQGTAGEKEK